MQGSASAIAVIDQTCPAPYGGKQSPPPQKKRGGGGGGEVRPSQVRVTRLYVVVACLILNSVSNASPIRPMHACPLFAITKNPLRTLENRARPPL